MQPADHLELQLLDLAQATVYPPTPDIAGAISTRLAPHSGERHGRWRLAIAGAAALSLLAAASALLIAPGSREAVADFLGLGVKGERIEQLPPQPSPSPGATPTPTPPPIDAVAERTTLEAASAALSFEPIIPAGIEITDVFALEYLGLDGIVLRTPTYDLWQFDNNDVFLGKGVPGQVRVQQTTVDGLPAYWITGGPRILTGRDAAGNELTPVVVSTSGNALVWAEGAVTLRLVGNLGRDQAIVIAESLR
jgi:hypothetical protein